MARLFGYRERLDDHRSRVVWSGAGLLGSHPPLLFADSAYRPKTTRCCFRRRETAPLFDPGRANDGADDNSDHRAVAAFAPFPSLP